MKKLIHFFKRVKVEFGFIRGQYGKIIWPQPLEAFKIFLWTFSMLLFFGVMITFVFDPASLAIVSWLSSLRA